MMDNENFVKIEGYVAYDPEIKENNGKRAMNFVIENERRTRNGKEGFKYHCVAWEKVIDRSGDRIKQGEFVRITGHLQDSLMRFDSSKIDPDTKEILTEAKDFHYTKVCADFIEFDD